MTINMEQKALLYLKQMLDKATQKGAFTLDETANIVNALEAFYTLLNPNEAKEDSKEENLI
jgi:triosephosphate isomerase